MSNKTAIIVGAGPAGLTAAYELLTHAGIKPLIVEASSHLGGISKTITYKGNRMDLGPHRFFSKSNRVLDWWLYILPLREGESGSAGGQINTSPVPDSEKDHRVMLVRERLTRILFLKKLFAYPITLNVRALANLGFIRVAKIAVSYAKAILFPIKDEKSLADFFINRFGKELYSTFFKDYTEKVWGVPCDQIKPEWGSQRVKGLSVAKAITHAVKRIAGKTSTAEGKGVETSLIEKFMYPKLGAGQIWEEVANRVREMGGQILLERKATGIRSEENRVTGVVVRDEKTGEEQVMTADYVFSTMPVKDLVGGWDYGVPQEVRQVASNLPYRDFITVGLLLKRLILRDTGKAHGENGLVRDNWIYIQEKDVKVGRLEIFNNWSPCMVKDPGTVWIGLEYFCDKGDALWNKSDLEFLEFAVNEVERIGAVRRADVLDGVVLRMEKAYPAYFGSYEQFDVVRKFTDKFVNLFLIGRNGMHRYNNMDHSMMTAMVAVDNIVHNVTTKDNIWEVNTEEDYHEEK
jgi:protoporphyrinogen oxidase